MHFIFISLQLIKCTLLKKSVATLHISPFPRNQSHYLHQETGEFQACILQVCRPVTDFRE